MYTRTKTSTWGVVLVCLGIAFIVDLRYAIDLTVAIPIIFIPTGLYVVLVPKRIKEDNTLVAVKSETEKKEGGLLWTLKAIGLAILFIPISLLIAYQVGGGLGVFILVLVGGFQLLSDLTRKRK